MHFTSAISVFAAYALFATANGAVIHDDLSVALARLEAAHAEVTNAVHARDVNSPAAEPATIVSDITKITSDGLTMGSDIAKLIADLKASPQAASQPDAATITSDALKISSDITTLVSDIAKLAADSKAPSSGSPAPAPKIPGFPFARQ